MAIQNAVSNQFLTTTSTPAFVNVINGFTSTATAAGTTVLTATSTGIQEFTGSTTQTVTMPVVSTLPRTGVQYYIVNNSSGVVTVQSSGANTIQAMDANTSLLLTCILATGTTAASWNATYFADSGLAGAVLLAPTGNQTITGAFNLIMGTGSMVAPTMLPGNLSLTGNTISSTNSNGDIDFIPNGTGTPIFGATTPYVANSSSVFFANIMGVAKQAGLAVAVYNSGGTVLPGFQTLCSRGATIGSFGAVNSGDIVGQYIAQGTDGSAIQNVGRIRFYVANTVSSGIIPGGFQVRTTNTSGVETTALTIDETQTMSLLNPLPPASGGTGSGTAPSAGQIPIGTSANIYTPAAINSGTGIVVANGSGSITISATGGGVTWSTIAGTTQAAAVDHGYVSGNAGQTTVTLPATAALGSTVGLEGLGAGGWILAANTGQTIKIGSSTTSSAGSLTSAAASDNVYVTCIVANTTWRVQTTNSAGLTIA